MQLVLGNIGAAVHSHGPQNHTTMIAAVFVTMPWTSQPLLLRFKMTVAAIVGGWFVWQ